MLTNYLIVDEAMLPDVFSKVIAVKKSLDTGEFNHVSDAIKHVGISRSAYYKYKDHVFSTQDMTLERKALISFVLSDKKGILSYILKVISENGGSVLTINQNIPIQKKANVLISLDIKDLQIPIQELLNQIEAIEGVSKINLVSVE
ncbi:MAG: ACT domain-containing protein [Vagococcus sp.]